MQHKNHNFKDITGQRFGRLVAIECIGSETKGYNKGRALWKFKCDCGKKYVATGARVRNEHIKSCGCSHKESSIRNFKLASEKNKLSFGQAHLNAIYLDYKTGATKRNLIFNLTKDEFCIIVAKTCIYCGTKPKERLSSRGSFNGHAKCNGIDRIDNTIGYSLENSVHCCAKCNYMKGKLSKAEFLEQIEKIYSQLLLTAAAA